MDIKSAIKQKAPFRSAHHKAFVNLMFTHGWLISQSKTFFKAHGITQQQYNILRILNGSKKPLTTSNIRDRLLDKMSDTTRVIDRMIKKGLVQKKTNTEDRRLVDITMTQHGQDILKNVDKKAEDIDQTVGNLTIAEAEQLSDLLDKCRG